MEEKNGDPPDGGGEEMEVEMDGEVVKRIPAPRKGLAVILTHDTEDGRALLGTLVRSANMLTALLAAMDAAANAVPDLPGGAPPVLRAIQEGQALVANGQSFIALRQLMMRLYPEGAQRFLADVESLRSVVLSGAGAGEAVSVDEEASRTANEMFQRVTADVAQESGAETPQPQTDGSEPLFIPKAPKVVS